jgi:hypothetical protein
MAFCRMRGFACKFLIAQAGSFDLNVDAIERATGDFRAVALNLQWSTNAFLPSADRLGMRRRSGSLLRLTCRQADTGVVDNPHFQNVPKTKAEGVKPVEITKDRKKYVRAEIGD